MIHPLLRRILAVLIVATFVASLTPRAEAAVTGGYSRGGGNIAGEYTPFATGSRTTATGIMRTRIDCVGLCIGSVQYNISWTDPTNGATGRVTTAGIYIGNLEFGINADGNDTARTNGVFLGFTNETPFFFASFLSLYAIEGDPAISFGRRFEYFTGELETGSFNIHDASFL